MIPEHHLTFGPFRLETPQGRLWRGDQGIPLRPRSLAMLGYLVAHAGRLVTKAEVLQHVWGAHMLAIACCGCRCRRFGRRWVTRRGRRGISKQWAGRAIDS